MCSDRFCGASDCSHCHPSLDYEGACKECGQAWVFCEPTDNDLCEECENE